MKIENNKYIFRDTYDINQTCNYLIRIIYLQELLINLYSFSKVKTSKF